jgi:leucyl aminopeptidase
MKFSTKAAGADAHRSPLGVFGVFEGRKLSAPAAALDKAAGGALAAVLARGDHEGKAGSTRLLYGLAGFERVLLVGLGKEAEFGPKAYREAIAAATRAATDTGAASASLFVADLGVARRSPRWKGRHAVIAAAEALYRFDAMKSKKAEPRALAAIEIVVGKAVVAETQKGVAEGEAIAGGIDLAKDLGNLPGNVCTPTHLADTARRLAQEFGLECEILERKDMEKLGMNTLLSVTRGSAQPPKLIVLRWQGGPKKQKPVCLVGKGITFDTGGISLKPGEAMDEMKFDMSGAGSVIGTLRAVAAMKLKMNVYGIVAAVENMPDGAATKPGDIVTSLSGQTVEILNTDAEGRLVLCDALTWIERYEPEAVIDIATLTGACVVALGHVVSGLFSNKDALAKEVLAAGEESWDRAWHLPLHDEYQEQLKSNFADFANIGGRPAGAVTAACFLARFTKKYPWAHLDIAGTAWKSGAAKGSTGRPVPLLTQFLLTRAGR